MMFGYIALDCSIQALAVTMKVEGANRKQPSFTANPAHPPTQFTHLKSTVSEPGQSSPSPGGVRSYCLGLWFDAWPAAPFIVASIVTLVVYQ